MKIKLILICVLSIMSMLFASCSEDIFEPGCNKLKIIQGNEILKSELRKNLQNYINSPNFHKEYSKRAGLTVNFDSFEDSFEPVVSMLGISTDAMKLTLLTMSGFKTHNSPYIIKSAGLYTGRARLIFHNQNIKSIGNDVVSQVVFKENSDLECNL